MSPLLTIQTAKQMIHLDGKKTVDRRTQIKQESTCMLRIGHELKMHPNKRLSWCIFRFRAAFYKRTYDLRPN